MSIFVQIQKCLICSEQYNRMIPLEQSLDECQKLSVAQVLHNLQFLTVSDAVKFERTLCFLCVTKVLSCYDFKMQCCQTQNALETLTNHLSNASAMVSTCIKLENRDQTFDKFHLEQIYITDQGNVYEDNCSNDSEGKREIKIEEVENIFSDSQVQEESTITNYCPKQELGISANSSDKFSTQKLIRANGKMYTCNICCKTFNRSSNLYRHTRKFHIEQKSYDCNVCNISFSHESNLISHKSIHDCEKTFVCNVCNKGFNCSSQLLSHCAKKHLECDVCGKSFNYVKSLMEHKMEHSDAKPYVCDVCDKSFRKLNGLKSHKLIHSGVKPYVCNVCGKSFKTSGNLSKHKLTHSIKKPYVCDVCYKAFKLPSSLNVHKLIHTGQKPYGCDVCYKSFNRSSNLFRHKKRSCGKKSYVCDVNQTSTATH